MRNKINQGSNGGALFNQVKLAEVRGCVAAFCDAGLVKVASQEGFDQLCEVVADNIGESYNLEKIASVTEAALTGGGISKTAAQQKTAHETARNAALGELLLMKTAGQIDDATFVKEAEALMKTGSGGWGQISEREADAFARSVSATRERAAWEADQAAKAAANRKARLAAKTISDAEWEAQREAARKANLARNTTKLTRKIHMSPYRSIGIGLGGASALAGGAYLAKNLYDKYYAA